MADDGVPHQRHIPNDVQDLVPHELVVEAQAIVEHTSVPDDDRVLERSSRSPAVRIISTSFRKPNVRAGAISSTNDSDVRRIVRDW